VDDNDKRLKVEVLPSVTERKAHLIDFSEVERLVESAKHELLAMAESSPVKVWSCSPAVLRACPQAQERSLNQ
jgi:hypothetical protein